MSEVDPWFRLGHVTHESDRTGCTAIVFDSLVPAAVDVRGGAPGTRETALLSDGMLVGRADAIVLTGGSAFGLAAADGVMNYLREQERGVMTSAGPVPIVPAAVIFDLGVGTARFPTAEDGYVAASTSTIQHPGAGRFGAGTGATVAKLGAIPGVDSGLGFATVSTHLGDVSAMVVLNAVGDIVDTETGHKLATARDPLELGRTGRELALDRHASSRSGENTTIGAVLLDAEVDRRTLARCCVSAHAALSRSVVPSHTVFDGDTMFAAGRQFGAVEALDVLILSCAAEIAIERAIAAIFRAEP
jgi:L-aminopeptidase/D-esterase-like protein